MTYEQKIQDCVSIAKKKVRARDKKKGIIKIIELGLEHDFDKETIIKDVMSKYPVSRKKVEKYLAKTIEKN